ncbi:SURF1 family protein [Paracoccus sp. R86501]|uniref:SURF1 family protein n=1 Tax=Paracoccus sp. R86501 TaxID=3101711 RepID=UPI00366C826C
MTAPARHRLSTVALAILAGATFLLLTLFVSLGAWQVQRLHWKQDLIARVDARLAADPVPAPLPAAWDTLSEATDEYRKVTLRGVFDHDDETLVKAVTELGGGFWVMTPLETSDATYLVNRGYVSPEERDPAARPDGQVAGPVTVTGLLRMSQPDGAFLRDNDPAAGRWYSRDVGAIMADRDGPLPPFFVDSDATPNPGGAPVGGLTVVSFRNSHLSYALTWFALAAGTLGAAFLVWRYGRRQDDR